MAWHLRQRGEKAGWLGAQQCQAPARQTRLQFDRKHAPDSASIACASRCSVTIVGRSTSTTCCAPTSAAADSAACHAAPGPRPTCWYLIEDDK